MQSAMVTNPKSKSVLNLFFWTTGQLLSGRGFEKIESYWVPSVRCIIEIFLRLILGRAAGVGSFGAAW